jgi:AraC-like DNA-binding protein
VSAGYAERPGRADGVACTWERTTLPGPAEHLVLPDGCVDLILTDDGALFVAGPDRGPVVSESPPGTGMVGVRLRPGRAGDALGLPASEVLDLRVALRELWGARAERLAERLAAIGDRDGRREVLEAAVARRLAAAGAGDPQVAQAVRRLGLPGARVGELSAAVGLSERQLLRRFREAVGYGPKTLDRVLRFRRLLGVASATEDPDLAALAATCGYADQAHLSRDCARLSGMSPRALLERWAAREEAPTPLLQR